MLRTLSFRGALKDLCELATGHEQVLNGTSTHARCMGQLALKNSAIRAGSEGRQSISGVVATVFGATGFLGRYVVSLIGEKGGRAVCPHRCDDMDMQHLRPMGDLGNIITLQEFSIRDYAAIKKVISKSNVVINLIGQNTETWNFGFKEVHEKWPELLAEACSNTPSVERLIHVSCLGADVDSPSPRLASKARGEVALQQAFPDATIMRCGPLVGVEDRFYTDLALWRFSNSGVPVIDGGMNKVQPVYVVDVAEAIYRSLEFEEAKGSTFELGGPSVVTMRTLGELICDELRENHKLADMPSSLAIPIAYLRDWMSRWLPMHMMTRDLIFTTSSIAEAEIDRVVSPGAKTFKDLHHEPIPTLSGVAIDHVRYWRKGGYRAGTNEPQSM